MTGSGPLCSSWVRSEQWRGMHLGGLPGGCGSAQDKWGDQGGSGAGSHADLHRFPRNPTLPRAGCHSLTCPSFPCPSSSLWVSGNQLVSQPPDGVHVTLRNSPDFCCVQLTYVRAFRGLGAGEAARVCSTGCQSLGPTRGRPPAPRPKPRPPPLQPARPRICGQQGGDTRLL